MRVAMKRSRLYSVLSLQHERERNCAAYQPDISLNPHVSIAEIGVQPTEWLSMPVEAILSGDLDPF